MTLSRSLGILNKSAVGVGAGLTATGWGVVEVGWDCGGWSSG